MKDKSNKDEYLEKAREYLRVNTNLRQALKISSTDELQLEYLGQGEHNKNFSFTSSELGRKFVLRINVASQPFHKNQIAYEFSALQALEQSTCTPKPLYCDSSARFFSKGAMVINFCEGEELNFDALRQGDLKCATQLMANIHAVPIGKENKAAQNLFCPKDPLRLLYDECISRYNFYKSSSFENCRITKWVERFIKALQPVIENSTPQTNNLHIINTETLPSHFLIPASSAKAAAANTSAQGAFCTSPGTFIDWERPIIGEVAQDLAYFVSPTTTFWDSNYLFPKKQVEHIINNYWRAVDGRFERGNFEERFQAFRMMTILRSVTWCCKALVQYGSAGKHKTEKTASKLPVYLSDEFMERLLVECF